MDLVGIRLSDALVLELALALRRAQHETTAARLEAAVASLLPVTTLTPRDRAAILEVTAAGQAELEPLRAKLLAEVSEPGAERRNRPT